MRQPSTHARLGVLRHVALHEQRGRRGVDAAGEVLRGGAPGALAQQLRVDVDGDGVQVDDAVERVVRLLQRDPLHQRPEVVAQVQRVAGGLHPRQHARRSAGGRGRLWAC
ncbi:hypothetical protein GCM10025868_34840 [Angustibacter aerolatus]|uniref:Uncharacterized protein n=1 Tax=Angustibacter aerolatus TaxID=1162965 RepID=A0ABQ6JM84_9ACTN|nr:hypothetical protein GCM10025868_34840 [Angustibacter aerolatus]